MITFMEPKQPSSSPQNSLDPQLWHACAGNTVHLPVVNSKVFYFPQGHAEHASGNVDFRACPKVPAAIPCRVSTVHFLADSETDEVYSKMTLVPIVMTEFDFTDAGDVAGANASGGDQEKMATFAKTLTQSDANNGGGFSVPRYCAEMIFPKLDYTADPPVQTILAKDVHGEVWKFRHIYRGTPRRHLLTTGWSNFVNSKKLVAGDSIVFMRAENSDIRIGIRRAKRGFGIGPEMTTGWNPGGFPALLPEGDENRLSSRHDDCDGSNWGSRGKVKAGDVVEAVTLAARRQPFDVAYYPRASTPEFCVRAALVKNAMQIRWCSRMRFKMPFETEDCSRISWFVGTILAAQVADPIQWPDSPWRLLQVIWDEPELLQNVKRVNPWLVEIVTNMPTMHLAPFMPPHKKMRLLSPHSDFHGEGVPIPLPAFSNNPFGCLPNNTPAGMQGARHAQFGGLSLPDIHRMQTMLPIGFCPPNQASPTSGMSNPVVPGGDENVCCSLTIGNSSHRSEKSDNTAKAVPFLLFGQPIVPESHPSPSHSDENVLDQNAVPYRTLVDQGSQSKPGSDTSPCKIFVESEGVGRSLDLSLLDSYNELYSKVKDLFGIDISDARNRVIYHDAAGLERQLGDTLFSDFAQTARRLTIQNNKSS